MTILRSIAALSLLIIMLNGCSMDPEEQSIALAMSKSQIESLSVEDKEQAIRTYRNNQSILQSTKLYSQMDGFAKISVTISDGKARMHPNYQHEDITPTRFTLNGNQCKNIQIPSKNSRRSASLSACYLNNQLYIDASSTNQNYPVGSIIIPLQSYHAGAQELCNIKTKGNAKLTKACITIVSNNTNLSLPTQKLKKAQRNKAFTAKPRNHEAQDDSIIHYET